MTEPPRIHPLGFFRTPPHDCGYLPNRKAITLFVDPRVRPDNESYTLLSQHGFRRSGSHVYRPRCQQCNACVPIRVPVDLFKPSRNQRRTSNKNTDIEVIRKPAAFEQEHFMLYAKYIAHRHQGGGMEDPDPTSYMDFLTASWADTSFVEFRLAQNLIGVAVLDRLDDGLSAVYTFFDPEHEKRSPGRFAILAGIELTRQLGLEWLYLGYWIEQCRKMAYKTEFSPHQKFVDGTWIDTDN
jgi:leucyl-tRNA---protein transferase